MRDYREPYTSRANYCLWHVHWVSSQPARHLLHRTLLRYDVTVAGWVSHGAACATILLAQKADLYEV